MTASASLLFPDLEQELAITRRTLERYPEGKSNWKPHEKSTSLGALAVHLAMLPAFGSMILAQDELDFVAQPYVPVPFETAADLVAIFDERVAAMRPLMAAADAPALARDWTMRAGAHVILKAPKSGLIRQLLISHIIHHRAQLGVYYRLVGVAVPSTYGPSADEAMM